MKNILRKKSGVSLIIAIVFVSALMLVMAGLFEAQIFTIQTVKNHELEGKADYLEEGVKEIAGWYAANASLGANISSDDTNPSQTLTNMMNAIYAMADDMMNSGAVDANDPNAAGQGEGFTCIDTNPDPQKTESCAALTIKGHAELADQIKLGNTSYYSVPIAKTGDAGTDCDKKQIDPNDPDNANDSCHWNKLKMGDSVEIPLYYMDGAAVSAHDFTAVGSAFILRVRTQCGSDSNNDGIKDINCDADQRIVLYPPEGDDANFLKVGVDKVLIQWTISDSDPASNKTLLAVDSKDNNTKLRLKAKGPLGEANTEISASRIDWAKDSAVGDDPLYDFIILEDKAVDKEGKDLNNIATSVGQFIKGSTKPVLRLSMVDMPRNIDNSANVPFLEYQLLTKTKVSDSKSLLTGSAKIGDFYKEFKTYSYRKQTAGGFVLESF